jgi:hypothetical protein
MAKTKKRERPALQLTLAARRREADALILRALGRSASANSPASLDPGLAPSLAEGSAAPLPESKLGRRLQLNEVAARIGCSQWIARQKLTMAHQKKRQALIPKPVLADTRPSGRRPDPARFQGLPAPSLGQHWPMAWPGQPGPFLREQGPFCGPPGAAPERCALALGKPLSVAEVAGLIGCSPWTVRQTLIPRGLPHFRFKANGRLVFYQDQVIRWIENQQQNRRIKTK